MAFNLIKIKKLALDIVFPKNCLGCGKEGEFICDTCLKLIHTAKSTKCFLCGKRSPAFYSCKECQSKHQSHLAGLLVASDWSNLLLRQIIYEFKYRQIQELSKPLGKIISDFLNENKIFLNQLNQQDLILIPVPLHKKRLLWRGFNQSEMLAENITIPNLKIQNCLLRCINTPPQMPLKDNASRQKNIKNAFILPENFNKNLLKNKTIILIDDICTTGSTLEECAKVLKTCQPKEIWGLVLARG